MSNVTPMQEWWTAQELAAARLPDLPASQQGVDALSKRLDWRAHPEFARRRSGRGGGWEYSWRLLPVRAQAALMKAVPVADVEAAPIRMDRWQAWAWFDGLPEKVKAAARDRLAIIQRVEVLEAPMGKNLAVETIAQQAEISSRTIWNWVAMIEGVDAADRLPYLAARHRAAKPVRERAECSQEFLDRIRADYLRLGGPSLRSAHRRVVTWCKARKLGFLEYRTTLRWFEANVPRVLHVLAREGEKGLARCFPPQIRDRSMLVAMEGVVADCHKLDVFVRWPEIEEPVRVQLIAFTDLYSNKVLSWAVDLSPNAVMVMKAFGMMVETWGIPRHCLFDNGREFANKWATGGTEHRFRFKYREKEAMGVLPLLGIKIHWATPGHGQAKPIERTFRDFADDIARHPAFAGAYVGPNPLAKPEDYGSKAIPLADFMDVVDACIQEHNARPGRLTDNAKGRSFDQTFAESYAKAPIVMATAEQQRLWLMGQDVRKLQKHHGTFQLFENSYWSDWMNEFVGQEVVARFDPTDLHAGLHIYSLTGEYLGPAECREAKGFFDLVGAETAARDKRRRKAAAKRELEMHRPVGIDQWAAELRADIQAATPLIEAKVVDLLQVQRRKPLMERPLPVPDTTDEERLVAFSSTFNKPADVASQAESPAERFHRMLDIERRSEAGEQVTEAEAEEWGRMQRLPEYQAMRTMYDRWGEDAVG